MNGDDNSAIFHTIREKRKYFQSLDNRLAIKWNFLGIVSLVVGIFRMSHQANHSACGILSLESTLVQR